MNDELLSDLAADRPGPCVSVYLPSGAADGDGRQSRIRWKNLWRKAEATLREQGLSSAQAAALLAPAAAFDPVRALQAGRPQGFAAFAAPGFFRHVALDLEPGEEILVGPHFHLRPLIVALAEPPRFYVLAFSRNGVRLLDASPVGAAPIPMPECPPTMEEALKYDNPERSVQYHTAPAGGSGRAGAIYHGQGGVTDTAKDAILRFARRVAPHVERAVSRDPRPLVLACVEYEEAIFRHVANLPTLEAEFVRGSPDRLRDEELAARAWEIVADGFQRGTATDADRFRRLAGTGRTASSVEEVVPAAVHGRVETLFVAGDRHAWGVYDAGSDHVTLREGPAPDTGDLLDVAALRVLEQGAKVHVVPREAMPAPSMAAAILRY